jgi:serine phosphatase RsbU (regulator of sigma subunit)
MSADCTADADIPQITGTLLSSMLMSMNDLGNLGNRLLAKNGVEVIEPERWYPRQVQHNCFAELETHLGRRALYSVGFAYQNLMRQRYSEVVSRVTEQLTQMLDQNLDMQDKLARVVDAAETLSHLLNSGSKKHVKHHPQDYGFYFNRVGHHSCQVSFSSFAVPAITPYCESIIYGMLRLAFPPQIRIHLALSQVHPRRDAGDHSDTFDIRFELCESALSMAEMRLQETLTVKESLLHAAVDAAERSEQKASRALAEHMESVNYASRIQRGLLAPQDALQRRFASQAVLWEPRDLIGGDIYWMSPESDEEFSVALVDCTGHGVPGALLSMLVSSTLERIYQIEPGISPGVALARLGDLIRSLLKQDRPDAQSRDGFDAAMCRIRKDRNEVIFASARIGLFIVPATAGRHVERIAGEQRALGYAGVEPHPVLSTHQITLQTGDVFVLVSDGVTDQVGQDKGFAFGNRRLTETLTQCIGLSAQATIDHLHEVLVAWQGNQPRRDDLSVFAFTL